MGIDLLSADLPTALSQLTAATLVVVGAWAALVGLLASWGPTARVARALTPRVLRAALFTTVSGTLAFSPAHAGSDLDGLPFPDRGTTVQPVAVETSGEHVVQAGDSLWSIAASTLPSGSGAADVASASGAWYAANRATIGPDPDVIHPGQQLVAPDVEAAR
jgi:nucleoid-associated protein YgaU